LRSKPQNEGNTTTENTDVVVIGGEYAGVIAASRLAQRDDVTVT
jgi:NADH dehydrogenase